MLIIEVTHGIRRGKSSDAKKIEVKESTVDSLLEDAANALRIVRAQIGADKKISELAITTKLKDPKNKLVTFLTTLYLVSTKADNPIIATHLRKMDPLTHDMHFANLVDLVSDNDNFYLLKAKMEKIVDRYIAGDATLLIRIIQKIEQALNRASIKSAAKLSTDIVPHTS